MSVGKQTILYNETGRGFEINNNFLQNIGGAFLTKKDFTLTDSDLDSPDYLRNAFLSNDIFPLHAVLDVINKREETTYIESNQHYTYKGNNGLIRHVLRFNWGLEFHKLVNDYSGSNLNVIYYDKNKNIILTEESTGIYRGVKTNRLVLEKFNPFSNGQDIVYSDLDIELFDSDEISVNGYIKKVDWLPELIDNEFISVTIGSIGSDFLNFSAFYNTIPIETISSSDVRITDDINGTLAFNFTNFFGGIYSLTGVSPSLTKGCLSVATSGYIGRTRYRVVITIEVENNAIWGDGNNEIWGDGNNAVYTN